MDSLLCFETFRQDDLVWHVVTGSDESAFNPVWPGLWEGPWPEEQSGIIEMPAPMAVSNLMLLDPKSGKPTRVRTRIDIDPKTKERTKERVSAKSGEPIRYSR